MKTVHSRHLQLILSLALSAFTLAPVASAVDIDWVTVGDPGNACQVQAQGCFGSVAVRYRISRTEVTNAQYAEFLNAVGSTRQTDLYHSLMGSGFGGITQTFDMDSAGQFSGSISYDVIEGRGNKPVNWVSLHDSLRFANWLHNGQPIGPQGNATTEDGAYTITLDGLAAFSIPRNAAATVFLPSQDEWYKAAYYDPLMAGFPDFTGGSELLPVCTAPGSAANTANCGQAVGDLTDVGAYLNSASPIGTFDQRGNVYEWTDQSSGEPFPIARGGSFNYHAGFTSAHSTFQNEPRVEIEWLGFRVASVIPEPSAALLIGLGLLSLGAKRKPL